MSMGNQIQIALSSAIRNVSKWDAYGLPGTDECPDADAISTSYIAPHPFTFALDSANFWAVDPDPLDMRHVRMMLDEWGLPHDPSLWQTGDGLALLANLCNLSAKCIDESYYNLKPTLIAHAQRQHDHCWQEGDVVYFETCEGQVSFHVFDDDVEVINPLRTPEQWAGPGSQEEAPELIWRFLS